MSEEMIVNSADFEENNNTEDSKIERYQINTFTQDRAVETLVKWYRNHKLIIPDFQRDYVWSFSNSCRLIESILLNLPIPNVFLFKIKDDKGEKFMLIDGLQRITTINQFINGEWQQGEQKRKFKIQSPNEKWDNKAFCELSEEDQQFIYDYPIGTTIFESSGGDELEQNNVIFSVFERINTGSEKLSDQEIRNAVYNGELLSVLKELIKEPDFIRLIDKDKSLLKRGKSIELLLRFVTYKHIYDKISNGKNYLIDDENEKIKITPSKKIMLNNYMQLSNEGKIDYKSECSDIMDAIATLSNYDETALCGKSANTESIGIKVHEVFAEALIIALAVNGNQIGISKEEFRNKKIEIWNSETLIEPFKYKTTDITTIKKRVDFCLKLIRGNV